MLFNKENIKTNKINIKLKQFLDYEMAEKPKKKENNNKEIEDKKDDNKDEKDEKNEKNKEQNGKIMENYENGLEVEIEYEEKEELVKVFENQFLKSI